MRAFQLDFRCYIVAEDAPAALRRGDELRRACKTPDLEPGAPSVQEVPSEDVARIPALQRLIDRATRPKYGPPATALERKAAERALSRSLGGDLAAQATLGLLEHVHGYLPRELVRALTDARPARGVA